MSRAFRFALVGLFTLPVLSACDHFHRHHAPEPEVIVPVEPIIEERPHRKYR
ncbi:MAG: hypothetical protein JJT95_16155 [Pararhodobacter sp.]|nr:hypothetical protein [Pararhodobacter sp.]